MMKLSVRISDFDWTGLKGERTKIRAALRNTLEDLSQEERAQGYTTFCKAPNPHALKKLYRLIQENEQWAMGNGQWANMGNMQQATGNTQHATSNSQQAPPQPAITWCVLLYSTERVSSL
jgi:hypothetical protein